MFHNCLLRSRDDDPHMPKYDGDDPLEMIHHKSTAICQNCASGEEERVGILTGTMELGRLILMLVCDATHFEERREVTVHVASMSVSNTPIEYPISFATDLRDLKNKRKFKGEFSYNRKANKDLLNGWLSECHEHHETCFNHKDLPVLPTRLIAVGGVSDTQVRLLETANMRGRWVALSYRWGPPLSTVMRTTSATLAEYRETITVGNLPRTIQDAIRVTRELEIPYLWVDRFCIIQDSKEDWEKESSRMATIYRDSYVTIAASSGVSDESSLYLDRLNVSNTPVEIKLGEKVHGSSARWLHGTRQPFRDIVKNDPLQARGWTLQETELSIRVIYFSEHEQFWQCREGVSQELAPAQLFTANDPLVPRRMFDAFAKWPMNIFTRFYDAVEEFTARELTYQTDMLPAMSGLAAEVAHFLHSRAHRRIATEREALKLSEPHPQEEIESSRADHLPFRSDGNASAAALFDQVELARRGPLPGSGGTPLRWNPYLSDHDSACTEQHDISSEDWESMDRIARISGLKEIFKDFDNDDPHNLEELDRIMRLESTHRAQRTALAMTRALLHDRVQPEDYSKSITAGFSLGMDAMSGFAPFPPVDPSGTTEGSYHVEEGGSDSLNNPKPCLTGDSKGLSGQVSEPCCATASEARSGGPIIVGPGNGAETYDQGQHEKSVPQEHFQTSTLGESIDRFLNGPGSSTNEIAIPEGESSPPRNRTSLYVYPDLPFAPTVEWPDVVTHSDYVAGIWLKDIWYGLSWYVRAPQSKLEGLDDAPNRETGYRAPSWSWASVTMGRVGFIKDILTYMRDEDGSMNSSLCVLEARVNVIGQNPYGHVQSGRLVLQGRVMEFPFFDAVDEEGNRTVEPKCDGAALFEGDVERFYRDTATPLSPFCKALAIDHRCLLVIEPAASEHGRNVFRRVGLVWRDQRDNQTFGDYDGGVMMTVTLI